MLIKEYRIILPVDVSEYKVAQLWSVAEASKNETGGGEGVEVLINEPFSPEAHIPTPSLLNGDPDYKNGQYTYKIYHVDKKVPSVFKMVFPKGALKIQERAWNAYPYCRTELENPGFMKDNFKIIIETMHKGDRGNSENIHQLPENLLKEREVIFIDIANDELDNSNDYKPQFDPKLYKSVKTDRGPLKDKPWWINYKMPIMCAYKLVICEFKWWGLQTQIEKMIHKQEKRVFTNFHRMLFCWTDNWYGLTMDDIRSLERETQKELAQNIRTGKARGTLES